MTKDMTVGSPTKLILNFSWPLALGFLFNQLYSIVDAIIVGQLLGVEALAGVGSTSSLIILLNGFCYGISGGFAIPIAQEVGSKNAKALKHCIINSIYLCVIFAALFTVSFLYWCHDILMLLNTPKDIFKYAYDYIFIIFAGIPFMILSAILSSILRSFGDSKSTVYVSVASSLLHIVLDFLLILVFDLGVKGAAISTMICHGLSCVAYYLIIIKKYDIFRFDRDDLKIRLKVWGRLCYMGVSMALQYTITAIGTIILQKAVNNIGTDAVAAVTAANKLNNLLQNTVIDAICVAMATYAGQNAGAKRIDRVKKGVYSALLISFIYSIFSLIMLLIFFDKIILAFLSPEETAIIAMAKQYILILVACYPLVAILGIMRMSVQGMGFAIASIFCGALETLGRVSVVLFLIPTFGFIGACFSDTAAWVASDLYVVPMFFIGTHILNKRFQRENQLPKKQKI